MVQKVCGGNASWNGGASSSGCLVASGREGLSCESANGPSVGGAGGSRTVGSRRLEQSSARWATCGAGHFVGDRRSDLGGPSPLADNQRVGRIRCGGDSARTDRTAAEVFSEEDPFVADDRSHPGQTRRAGWSAASASAATAEGLVSAACGSAEGRTRQRRSGRRTGHSRRATGRSLQPDQPAWRLDEQLRESLLDHGFRAEIAGTALARARPSGVHAVRQRHGVSRTASARRCLWSRHTHVSATESDPGVRAAARVWFSKPTTVAGSRRSGNGSPSNLFEMSNSNPIAL